MKLEEIQEFWHKDREIDYSELGTESIRIPQIHDKYLKIYTDERIRLRSLEFELAKLVRAKTDLYSGRMPEEDIEKRGCCLLYTSPSPRDRTRYRMPSSA